MIKSPVIVTDALWRKSVSAIRSLGKAGFPVVAMGDSVFTSGFWSRYTTLRFRGPTAANDFDGFGGALRSLLHNLQKSHPGQKPVLVPMEDATLRWVSANRALLAPSTSFLIPSQLALDITQNKYRSYEAATSLDIPCPTSVLVRSTEEALAAIGTFHGPFIAKPQHGSGSAGLVYQPPAEADFWNSRFAAHGEYVVQARIPAAGEAVGICALMDANSEVTAIFAHKRLKEYPVTGGPSTDRVSIALPTDLEEMSVRLLKHLRWQGPAMVEWKFDATTNRFVFLEINPRFWGSLELAVRAGVDFPALYARLANGESPAPVRNYTIGTRCRWFMPGEVLRYLSTPSPQRESLAEFLRGLPGMAEEWDPTDLRGGLSTLICTMALALQPRYWKYVLRG